MKDEIKEILELLNFNRDTISNGTCRVEDFMSREQIIKLLDYITNLQEDNEKLKEEVEQNKNPLRGIFAQVTDDDLLRNNGAMYSELEDYKSRNEKAIECIKDNLTREWGEYLYGYEDLLNILNGGDEEC